MPCGINTMIVTHAYGLDLRISAGAVAWSTAIAVVVARRLGDHFWLGHPVQAGRDADYDPAHALPGRVVHRRGGGDPASPLHQPRPPGLLPGQPARDGEGRDVRPLLALRRARCGGCSWRSSPPTCPRAARPFDGVEGERAAGLYERVFIGYGDDSIGQVGGAHLACEWVSNILTKVLQRGRLAAYLEQSTRYIPYDQPMAGGRRLPLLPRRASWASPTRPPWTSCSGSTPAASSRFSPGRRSAGRGATSPRARGGARSAPSRSTCCGGCSRLDAQPRRHLRLRPGLRAAAPASDGLSAAGGARVRRHDPRPSSPR